MSLHSKNEYRRRVLIGVWLIILLLSFNVGALPARAQSPGPIYVVQVGDTLYSIALAFGVTVEALQQANTITDPSLLAVGQQLVIPGFGDVSGALAIYRVRLGETLPGLAKRLGVTQEVLIRLNRLTNAETLYVGQSLIYPEGGNGIAAGRTWVATKSDSLVAIAARSNLSPWALALINDLDPSIYLGQHVILPGDPANTPPLTGLPAPFQTLALKPDRPLQGGTIEIVAGVTPGVTLTGRFYSWPLQFVEDANDGTSARLIALQGIDALTDPGLYLLTLTATAPDGSLSTFEQLVPVASADYPFQTLYVGAELSTLLDPSIVVPEREQVNQIVSSYSPARQWSGIFLKPVPSERITTGFGWRRSYNGGPFDSYHDGIDYGAPGGTVISAPANGTVVFAGPLQVRGNTTIIDHGWGVFTGYWHQYKIYVQVGQVVQQGEAIGEVGSSGLSTGSHLHFAMWVGGNAVNPEQWLAAEFP